MTTTVDWPGQSGKTYRYYVLENPTKDGIQAIAGNYCFAKQLPNGNFASLYFGEAIDLRDRIPGHERLEKRLGSALRT